jgi:hypothetical protein
MAILGALPTSMAEVMEYRHPGTLIVVSKDVIPELHAISDFDVVEFPALGISSRSNSLIFPTSLTKRVVVIATTHRHQDNIATGGGAGVSIREVVHEKPRVLALPELEAQKVSNSVPVVELLERRSKEVSSESVTVSQKIPYREVTSLKPRPRNIEDLVVSWCPLRACFLWMD